MHSFMVLCIRLRWHKRRSRLKYHSPPFLWCRNPGHNHFAVALRSATKLLSFGRHPKGFERRSLLSMWGHLENENKAFDRPATAPLQLRHLASRYPKETFGIRQMRRRSTTSAGAIEVDLRDAFVANTFRRFGEINNWAPWEPAPRQFQSLDKSDTPLPRLGTILRFQIEWG